MVGTSTGASLLEPLNNSLQPPAWRLTMSAQPNGYLPTLASRHGFTPGAAEAGLPALEPAALRIARINEQLAELQELLEVTMQHMDSQQAEAAGALQQLRARVLETLCPQRLLQAQRLRKLAQRLARLERNVGREQAECVKVMEAVLATVERNGAVAEAVCHSLGARRKPQQGFSNAWAGSETFKPGALPTAVPRMLERLEESPAPLTRPAALGRDVEEAMRAMQAMLASLEETDSMGPFPGLDERTCEPEPDTRSEGLKAPHVTTVSGTRLPGQALGGAHGPGDATSSEGAPASELLEHPGPRRQDGEGAPAEQVQVRAPAEQIEVRTPADVPEVRAPAEQIEVRLLHRQLGKLDNSTPADVPEVRAPAEQIEVRRASSDSEDSSGASSEQVVVRRVTSSDAAGPAKSPHSSGKLLTQLQKKLNREHPLCIPCDKLVGTGSDLCHWSPLSAALGGTSSGSWWSALDKLASEDPGCNAAVGCLVGLALGDAAGAPLEFCAVDCQEPGSDPKRPVLAAELREGQLDYQNVRNKFDLKQGQWTDDASMALCLADSLLTRGVYDGGDVRVRWHMWWFHGYCNAFRYDTERRKGQTSVGLGSNVAKSLGEVERALATISLHLNNAGGTRSQLKHHTKTSMTPLLARFDGRLPAGTSHASVVPPVYQSEANDAGNGALAKHQKPHVTWPCKRQTEGESVRTTYTSPPFFKAIAGFSKLNKK
ncbi:unnamed protein product [Effrenium voratum]|nr:unnamed protein product [Effrenium voratum]